MFVVQLVGRMADSVVEMPFHVATSCLANGTVRRASEAEIMAAGLEVVIQAPAITADSAFPEGYRVEPTPEGGYDLFEPGGIRLNQEPYINMAAARSAAIQALDMHFSALIPVEEALSQEAMEAQIANRPERNFTLNDYQATPVDGEEGVFHVYDPGGIRLTEDPVIGLEAARAFAAEHLRLMLAQGEGPLRDGDKREDAEVVVPDDWQTMHHMKVKALARLILGEEPANLDAAKAAIEDYLRRKAG